jgi:iron complex transport system ATP-binding protein
VDRVDLALRPGEVTAVVGPNGAGKSTLLHCLAGLRRPDAGSVTLNERPLSSLAPRERARRIGYLPQTPEIAWRLDARTFVRLGRTPHQRARADEAGEAEAVTAALARTGLTALAERDVTTLSGGERARALIARALAGQPDWLLADEPLTGLDPSHQLDAGGLLEAIARSGGGVVASLHDLSFAARTAHRVVVLAQGRILADGPPRLALRPEVLAAAYHIEGRWIEGGSGPLLDIVGRLKGGGGPEAVD